MEAYIKPVNSVLQSFELPLLSINYQQCYSARIFLCEGTKLF